MSRFSRTPEKTQRARELRKKVSKTEYKLWPYLRGAQLGVSFRRQHPVGEYFLDYACPSLKFGIEVDGPWHDMESDARRDAELKKTGWTVLRFGVEAVDQDIGAVIDLIVDTIQNLKSGQETPP
jgi:very-short-patch-repair endonuclease